MKRRRTFSATGCALKLVAGVLMVGLLTGLVAWLAQVLLPTVWRHDYVIAAACFAAALLGIELATVLLAPGETTPFGILGPKQRDFSPEYLKKTGQLVEENFRATRAFAVKQTADEGLHYFVELEDGRVIYLEGQYLYDFEPITDDPELNQARQFPCTEFTIQRHAGKVQFFYLVCGGKAFEPEVETPPFVREDFAKGRIPQNGEIIKDSTYEEIKRERLSVGK